MVKEDTVMKKRKRGRAKGAKNIKPEEKICFFCKTTNSVRFLRFNGTVYCERHYRQLKKTGELQEISKFDPNRYTKKGDAIFIELLDRNKNIVGIAIIDCKDYHLVEEFKWSLSESGYAVSRTTVNEKSGLHYMHKIILSAKKSDIGDHIDGNKLNNRRSNLRIVDSSKNAMNKEIRKDNTSGFTGVTFCKNINKWLAQIGFQRRNITLGYYENIEDAIEARKKAEIELFSEYSRNYRDEALTQDTNTFSTDAQIKKEEYKDGDF